MRKLLQSPMALKLTTIVAATIMFLELSAAQGIPLGQTSHPFERVCVEDFSEWTVVRQMNRHALLRRSIVAEARHGDQFSLLMREVDFCGWAFWAAQGATMGDYRATSAPQPLTFTYGDFEISRVFDEDTVALAFDELLHACLIENTYGLGEIELRNDCVGEVMNAIRFESVVVFPRLHDGSEESVFVVQAQPFFNGEFLTEEGHLQ